MSKTIISMRCFVIFIYEKNIYTYILFVGFWTVCFDTVGINGHKTFRHTSIRKVCHILKLIILGFQS